MRGIERKVKGEGGKERGGNEGIGSGCLRKRVGKTGKRVTWSWLTQIHR